MNFQVETVVNRKAMTAMAKAARKTLRRKRNVLVRTFGGIACVMAVLSGLLRSVAGDPLGWIDLLLAVCLFAFILLEDTVNGWFAIRQVSPDNAEVRTVFRSDGYTNSTLTAENHWPYDKIQVACEMKDFFVFLLDRQTGQVYAKKGFTKGTVEEFRKFIQEQTGKPVQYI